MSYCYLLPGTWYDGPPVQTFLSSTLEADSRPRLSRFAAFSHSCLVECQRYSKLLRALLTYTDCTDWLRKARFLPTTTGYSVVQHSISSTAEVCLIWAKFCPVYSVQQYTFFTTASGQGLSGRLALASAFWLYFGPSFSFGRQTTWNLYGIIIAGKHVLRRKRV